MCGLAGYCSITNKQFIADPSLLRSLHTSIAHRGPDGFGSWVDTKRQIALVHRRLSIIDVSDAGAQPMTDVQKSVVVVFNGEIYNYQRLRAELEGLGYQFQSRSDTEVILYAYKQWGIDCIKRLDGMFAIALFDVEKNELFLVRDRIGIKPLYFSLQGGMLSFASEIKALWQLPWLAKRIKPQALHHYLSYLATPAPMTLYEGVYKLPAGCYAYVDAKRTMTFTHWYDPVIDAPVYAQKDLTSPEFCVKTIRSLLRASVKKRMMSDVPIGLFLSGGVDSSLNVALMSEFTDQIKTFNVSFSDGPEYEERAWARKVAKQFGTEHYELIIAEKEAFNFFQKMVYHQDEPIGDCVCVPLYYVAKLAKDAGVTVVQVGEGADELFCGYDLYTKYLRLHPYWKTSQQCIPALARKGAAQLFSRWYPARRTARDLLRSWAQGRELFWSGALVFSEQWKQELVAQQYGAIEPDPIIEQIYPGMSQGFDSYDIADYHRAYLKQNDSRADFLKTMTYLELKHRLPELLLMRVDKMAMATAIEARVPFLDHALVNFALQIPTSLKYHDGQTKYILKKAAETFLPREIIYRKKVGFAAPTTRWFKSGTYFKTHFADLLHSKKGEWSDMLHVEAIDALLKANQTGSVDYSYQLWALHNVLAFDTK